MEEILRTMLDIVRAHSRQHMDISAEALDLWRNDYRFKGRQFRSIKAALLSQHQAGLGGAIFEGMMGDTTLQRFNYGVNPALGEKYRYSVLITCVNVEGGPDFKWMDVVSSTVELSSVMLHTRVEADIAAWKRGELDVYKGGDNPQGYATCSTEVLYAERRDR